MVSDSISNAPTAVASSNPKDFAKKKRANRSAKLKQCKLDARREQWLSQVNYKGGSKEEVNDVGVTSGARVRLENEGGMPVEKLEINPRSKEDIYGGGSSMHHDRDSESSPLDSPTSHSSSVLGSNDSCINFTARSSSSSGGSSNSCSTGSFSGGISEEDEGDVGDDGCLDDWEAMADALAASEDKWQEHSPNSGPDSHLSENHGNSPQYGSHLSTINQSCSGNVVADARQMSGGTAVRKSPVHCHAWRADDAFRPRSLPNLSNQYSLSEQRFDRGGSIWRCKTVQPVPTSCPICYEDLDCTDSSFLPCLCGFRLCLFCHKRILEDDGRCPGCRKQYDRDPVKGRGNTGWREPDITIASLL